MIIEETILVRAPIDRVWLTFTDLGCWKDWNTVLQDVSPTGPEQIAEGTSFRCSLRPFAIPLFFEPTVTEVILHEKVVWTSSKYGINARHEFLFKRTGDRIEVTSRETFTGLPPLFGVLFFPKKKIQQLTITMLQDLKRAAESTEE